MDATELPDFQRSLNDLAAELKALHKHLLDLARADWERTHGPLEAMAFFRVVTQEPTFAPWLKPLTQVLTLLDEYLDFEDAPTLAEVKSIRRDVTAALTPAAADDAYARVLQSNPEVVAAQAAVRRALEQLPPLVSAATANEAESLHEKHRWVEGRRHAKQQQRLSVIRSKKA